jgi:glycosyltransferase involved in cell wall biosynthesis
MKHKVSACIITFNEERNLRECLESVKWADEIVVIDSGSTDATVAIAKEYTERVYVRDWPGHVAQKNRALEAAANDWVFCIDADERVTPPLRAEIARVLEGEPAHAGYTVPRLTWYLGRWIRHGAWYPDRKLRLFRRSLGRFEGSDPHDRAEVRGTVGRFRGDLLHYSYRDLAHHLQQLNKYTDTMAQLKAQAGMGFPVLRMLTRPPAKFLKMYVLRLGVLDGAPGFIAAVLGAVYEFMKYAKLWEVRRGAGKDERRT